MTKLMNDYLEQMFNEDEILNEGFTFDESDYDYLSVGLMEV